MSDLWGKEGLLTTGWGWGYQAAQAPPTDPEQVPRAWGEPVQDLETELEDNSLQRASPQPTQAVFQVLSAHIPGICPGPCVGCGG